MIVVYTLLVFLVGSVMFFSHSLKKEASSIFKDSPALTVRRVIGGRHELTPLKYVDAIKTIDGTSSVRGRLWGYYQDPVTRANYTLIVPKDFPYREGSVVIGDGVRKSLQAEAGDTIPFRTSDGTYIGLTVEEVYTPEQALLSADIIVMGERDFRRLFGIPDRYVTDITLDITETGESLSISKEIKTLLPETGSIRRGDILRTYEAAFSLQGGLLILVLLCAGSAQAIFILDRTSGLSNDEREEIGTLKALGWRTSDVILMKFWAGVVISLSSFFPGVLLAYAHVFFASSSLFEPLLKGWAVINPELRLIPHIDISQFFTLFFFATVPYTMITVLLSWRVVHNVPSAGVRQ